MTKRVFRFGVYAAIVTGLLLLGQRCVSCATGPDVFQKEQEAAFLVGVDNEYAACKHAGFEHPVWRHIGHGIHLFYCVDHTGVLQLMLPPEDATMASTDDASQGWYRVDAYRTLPPSSAEKPELAVISRTEFTACRDANLVQPVWLNDGVLRFFCASETGALYPVLAPEPATNPAWDKVPQLGKTSYSHR